jgi:hypothetical protein
VAVVVLGVQEIQPLQAHLLPDIHLADQEVLGNLLRLLAVPLPEQVVVVVGPAVVLDQDLLDLVDRVEEDKGRGKTLGFLFQIHLPMQVLQDLQILGLVVEVDREPAYQQEVLVDQVS